VRKFLLGRPSGRPFFWEFDRMVRSSSSRFDLSLVAINLRHNRSVPPDGFIPKFLNSIRRTRGRNCSFGVRWQVLDECPARDTALGRGCQTWQLQRGLFCVPEPKRRRRVGLSSPALPAQSIKGVNVSCKISRLHRTGRWFLPPAFLICKAFSAPSIVGPEG